jgi:hypothetical protein
VVGPEGAARGTLPVTVPGVLQLQRPFNEELLVLLRKGMSCPRR